MKSKPANRLSESPAESEGSTSAPIQRHTLLAAVSLMSLSVGAAYAQPVIPSPAPPSTTSEAVSGTALSSSNQHKQDSNQLKLNSTQSKFNSSNQLKLNSTKSKFNSNQLKGTSAPGPLNSNQQKLTAPPTQYDLLQTKPR